MKSVLNITLAIVSLFFATQAHAKQHSEGSTLYLGTGATFYNMGKVTSSDDASTSITGQIYVPHLLLSVQFPVLGFKLMPTFTYTPLSVKASDSITKKILTAGLIAVFETSAATDLKTGLGMLVYYVGGPGGTTVLNNGTGIATFSLPSTTNSSKSVYLDLGFGFKFGRSFRLDLDALVLSALSTRRSVSTILSLSKGIF
jgi:hypothetical protein